MTYAKFFVFLPPHGYQINESFSLFTAIARSRAKALEKKREAPETDATRAKRIPRKFVGSVRSLNILHVMRVASEFVGWDTLRRHIQRI